MIYELTDHLPKSKSGRTPKDLRRTLSGIKWILKNGVAIKSGDNVAWSGTGWDDLGAAMDVSSFMRFYIGATQPTDITVIWLDTNI